MIQVLGIVVGIGSGMYVWHKLVVTIIDLKGIQNVDTKIAICKSEFSSADGQKIQLTQFEGKDVFIVNETEMLLALEKIHYGERPVDADFGNQILYSHSYILSKGIPDYYPWETPDQKVLVNLETEGDRSVRLWLRKATKGEIQP